jgi:hypothetical protein
MRKFSPQLATFPWRSESYMKDKSTDQASINLITTILEPGSYKEYKIQVPEKDFCTISGNSSELQPQW